MIKKNQVVYITFAILLFWACNELVKEQQTNNGQTAFSSSQNCLDYTLAWSIPKSIGLPDPQTIPGFPNADSLIHFLQYKADSFSWKTFIALSWPADDQGIADSSKCIGDGGTSVWEYWMPAAHIYRAENKGPLEWRNGTSSSGVPLNSSEQKKLRFLAKADDFTNLNASDAAVIDQNKLYTLYEIYYNREAYDYVVQSGLYSLNGQKDFVKNWPDYTSGLELYDKEDKKVNIQENYKRAYFPVGNLKDTILYPNDTTSYRFTINQGAMIIKSAWRSIGPDDDASLYHTRQETLSRDSTITLGLVGIHFIHKVAEATQWVWSTFEHIHNAPTINESGYPDLSANVDYVYFNENDLDSLDFNKPTHQTYEPDISDRKPTQVVREREVYEIAREVNTYFHDKLKSADPNSVWLNYRLIGTQWPYDPELFTSGDEYQPPRLANSVMETFHQSSASCLNCHKDARFLRDDHTGFNSDFIFSLNNAQ